MNARPSLGLPFGRYSTSAPAVETRGTVLPPMHDARALTGGGPTAAIVLDGQSYLLRITRSGKLILTK
ncbi:MAG: hemin uptake protein HemP [Rhodobacteraceae bacterium]|nr:hemin uptake protein HemP [Paracoccaceae bacterium]